MFYGAVAFSHYPKNWVISPYAEDVFKGTKVEEEARMAQIKKPEY